MDQDPDRSGDLSARTRRIREALARSGAVSPAVPEGRGSGSGSRAIAKAMRRHLKEERKERRAHVRGDDGAAQAIVFGMAALVMGGMALRQPWLWWMVFPAFGFAMAAAGILTRLSRRRRDEAPARSGVEVTILASPGLRPVAPKAMDSPEAVAIAARQARVAEICDRLVAELGSAPPAVRELLRKPDETVEALRAASAELARRERELRGALAEPAEERLRAERAALVARIGAETDEGVRAGLASALEALDAQVEQRKGLARAAGRIEAEGTRILYSLESLRARVLRVRAADAAGTGPAGEGLREGIELLSREMDAVATALEEVQTAGTARRPMPVPQSARG
jgi:prefoldin subunit 5